MRRQSWFRCMGLSLAAAAGLFVQQGRAADLVVTAYGGIWEEAVRACYVPAFEKKTGKTVDVVIGSPAQWMNQVAANPAKPPIDVMFLSPESTAEAIRRGIDDKINPSKLPHMNEIDPKFLAIGKGYAVPTNYGSMGLAYDRRRVKNPPKTWKEFVEGTVKGEWKAAVPGISYTFTPVSLIWTLNNVYGGTVDNIQPGLTQIKRMLDSGNLVLWNDVNEFLNLMQSGEIDIGMYFDGRAWAFNAAGNPDVLYISPKPGVPVQPQLIQKTKNGSELAWQFMDTVLSAGPQSCWGNKLVYGMTNKNVVFDKDIAPKITKFEALSWPPFDDISERMSGWVETWNKTIGR